MTTIKPTPNHFHMVVKPECETGQMGLFPTPTAPIRPVSHFGFTNALYKGICETAKPVVSPTGENEKVDESPSPSQSRETTCETVEELAVLRARLTNGYAWLQSKQDKPNALPNGAHLLEELIVKEYLPAIRRWRERLSEAERQDMALAYANEIAQADDATLDARLGEYLVAEDIASPRLLQDLLDRVSFWAGEGR